MMAIFLQVIRPAWGWRRARTVQRCRDWYPNGLRVPNWPSCEVAIGACDLRRRGEAPWR